MEESKMNCANCKSSMPEGSKFCQVCGSSTDTNSLPSFNRVFNQHAAAAASAPAPTIAIEKAYSPIYASLSNRYKDAYRVANISVIIGNLIKVIAVIIIVI